MRMFTTLQRSFRTPSGCLPAFPRIPPNKSFSVSSNPSLHNIGSKLTGSTFEADLKQQHAVRCRLAAHLATSNRLASFRSGGGTVAMTSTASGPPEEPAGMEQEAQLLTSLQEIPNISKCWLRPAQAEGLSLTVCHCTIILLASALHKSRCS